MLSLVFIFCSLFFLSFFIIQYQCLVYIIIIEKKKKKRCLFIWSSTETMCASKLANLSSISLLSASKETLDGDGGELLDFPCFVEGIIRDIIYQL